jgi:hypothetical protein
VPRFKHFAAANTLSFEKESGQRKLYTGFLLTKYVAADRNKD